MTTIHQETQLTPGRYAQQLLVAQLTDRSALTIPYTLIVGTQPGPRIVVTAGVHGDEYEGVRAIAELQQLLSPNDLHGTLLLIPVVNPPAFHAGTRISPLDGVNLNRVFPGNPEGSISEQLAALFFDTLVRGADGLIDMHSGGTRYLFHPQAGYYQIANQPALSGRSQAIAEAFGVDLVWEVTHRTGVLSFEAMQAGIVSIGVEIGGNGRCEAAHVALARHGILNSLAVFGSLPDRHLPERQQQRWVGDFTLAPHTGLFCAHVTLNERVQPGQLLYHILDLHGNIQYEHYAAYAGVVSAIRVFGMIQEGEWDIAVLQAVE